MSGQATGQGNILTGSANRDIKTTTGGLISGTHLDTSILTELSVTRVLHKRKVSGTGDGNRIDTHCLNVILWSVSVSWSLLGLRAIA